MFNPERSYNINIIPSRYVKIRYIVVSLIWISNGSRNVTFLHCGFIAIHHVDLGREIYLNLNAIFAANDCAIINKSTTNSIRWEIKDGHLSPFIYRWIWSRTTKAFLYINIYFLFELFIIMFKHFWTQCPCVCTIIFCHINHCVNNNILSALLLKNRTKNGNFQHATSVAW